MASNEASPVSAPEAGRAMLREAVVVALALAALYGLTRTSPSLAAGAFNDDGVYLALGKTISEGGGYHSEYAVGAPVHTKYPPLLPLLYAALWRFLGDLPSVHAAATLLSLLATAAALGTLWWFARAVLGLGASLAAFFVAGPFLLEASIQYFNLPLSEPWLMLAWSVTLVLLARAGVEHEGSVAPSLVNRTSMVAVGLTVAAATLFRSQGIVLVPAVLVALVLARRRPGDIAAFTAAATIPIATWKVWHGLAVAAGPLGTQPDEGAYVSWLPAGGVLALPGFLVELVGEQTRAYAVTMAPHVSNVFALALVAWLVFLALAALGIATEWRRHPALVATCLGNAAIVFLWPWAQDRFVLSLLPFTGLLAALGARALVRRAPSLRRVGFVAMLVVAGGVGVRQVTIRSLAFPDGPEERLLHPTQFLPQNTLYLLAASQWLQARTQPGTTVLAPHPSGIWLYTGRATVNATPALPDVGTTVWDEPGRFLARRLADDRPDLIALWNLNYLITRDVSVVQRECPQALEYLGFTEQPTRVAFYRVRYANECLRARVIAPARAELDREAAERG